METRDGEQSVSQVDIKKREREINGANEEEEEGRRRSMGESCPSYGKAPK